MEEINQVIPCGAPPCAWIGLWLIFLGLSDGRIIIIIVTGRGIVILVYKQHRITGGAVLIFLPDIQHFFITHRLDEPNQIRIGPLGGMALLFPYLKAFQHIAVIALRIGYIQAS